MFYIDNRTTFLDMGLETNWTYFIDQGEIVLDQYLVTDSGVNFVVFCVFQDLDKIFPTNPIDFAQVNGLAAVIKWPLCHKLIHPNKFVVVGQRKSELIMLGLLKNLLILILHKRRSFLLVGFVLKTSFMHTHIVSNHSVFQVVNIVEGQGRLLLKQCCQRTLAKKTTPAVYNHLIYAQCQLFLECFWLWYTPEDK